MRTVICKNKYEETKKILLEKCNEIDETGSFFSLYMTEYEQNGNVKHDFFDIISYAISIGYEYVNTIVIPTNENFNSVSFNDNVIYLIWLCKDKNNMIFNKDSIREKHIWKDVEWGNREKNYNPKGKDPGNVWIPTLDDGKANITKHISLSNNDIIDRIKLMTDCDESYEVFLSEFENVKLEFNECNKKEVNDIISQPIVQFGTSEKMNKIKDDSIKLAVTSPPYWDLKDYFKEGQIGQESYKEYLKRLNSVWKQCYNKLTDEGSLWININTRVKKGQVILIPKDIVEGCKKIGFNYKGIIIWHKSSGIPTNDKNIVDRHEYVLVFSKSENLILNKEEFSSFNDYKNNDINNKLFWNINRKAGSVGKKFIHPAIYPNGLVERIVKLASLEGEYVLDPFLGSGTSLIASTLLNRNFIGYEYNFGFKE